MEQAISAIQGLAERHRLSLRRRWNLGSDPAAGSD